jgi:site-specific DNA-cytosine methylase
MNIVTGCSGIDAIALIAELLDIKLIGQIEIDEFCNKIFELRYPGVKRLENVFDVRGDEFGTDVDIFAFGDPCQPHSVAGKQKGTADERYIWPELFRIIKTMRPTWIINENVTGSVSNGVVLGKINDLESEGYRARAFIIPACSVGAKHQRYRVILVGHAHGDRCKLRSNNWEERHIQRNGQWQTAKDNPKWNKRKFRVKQNGSVVGDTECSGCSGEFGRRSNQESKDGHSRIQALAHTEVEPTRRLPEREGEADTGFTGISQDVADPTREGLQDREQPGRRQDATETGTGMEPESERCGSMADTCGTGWEECNASRITAESGHNTRRNNASGGGKVNQSGMGGNIDGLPDRLYGFGGQEDGSGIFETFERIFTSVLGQIQWPAGYGQAQYDYEPPRVATGVKNRTSRLKALGNAIVWQQLFPFLLAIKLIEGGKQIENLYR